MRNKGLQKVRKMQAGMASHKKKNVATVGERERDGSYGEAVGEAAAH